MLRSFLQVTAAVGALALVPVASGAMAGVDTASFKELDTFMEVYSQVKANYVDKVDDKTLMKGAIQGMLAALDPHSSYADGLDFDNLHAARDEATRGLADLAKDALPGSERRELSIEVRDHMRRLLLRAALWFEVAVSAG